MLRKKLRNERMLSFGEQCKLKKEGAGSLREGRGARARVLTNQGSLHAQAAALTATALWECGYELFLCLTGVDCGGGGSVGRFQGVHNLDRSL